MLNFTPFQNLYQSFKGKDQKLFECFEIISNSLKSIIDEVASVEGEITVVDKILTAATTALNPPGGAGNELIFILRQDATGGRAITWNSHYFSGATTAITTTASTISTFRFMLSHGLYVMINSPSTGMVP